MNRVAIIQARYDSSRLPGKALADIIGLSALGWTVRAAKAISNVDSVIVATSDEDSDNPIADWCSESGTTCFRGNKVDVLSRMLDAAEAHNADIIMRLTGDCPFLDPGVCAQLFVLRDREESDYASNAHPSTWPDGLDCEVMTIETLRAAAEHAQLPSEREHVTRWIRGNRSRYSQSVLNCPIPNLHLERWTLDTQSDLDFLRAVATDLPVDRAPSYVEVLGILDREPQLRDLNKAELRNESLTKALLGDLGATSNNKVKTNNIRSYQRSLDHLHRAEKSIPMGSQTFSKSQLIYPAGKAPLFLSHGLDARAWDVDGNEYVDLVGGLLPIVLGYADPDVNNAIRHQLNWGVSYSLSTVLEAELAERIIRHVPSAESVRFGKNGTDATTGALRVARAFTNRERVAVGGYHGWQDWYIGSTIRNKGVPGAVAELTHKFAFNDISSLRATLEDHPGEFAAIFMEPVGATEPDPGYLEAVRVLADEHGALLIFDEVITGFRVAMGGAQSLYGVMPDMTCLGKALGNGMPISAIAGRADVMHEFEEVFYSGTFGGEALSLAAAIAVIDKLENHNLIEELWSKGKRLSEMVAGLINKHGLSDIVGLSGLDCWKHLIIGDHELADKFTLKTLFARHMFDNGVLMVSSHNICTSFSEANFAVTQYAYDKALSALAEALASGTPDQYLDCDPMRPVFSVRSSS